MDTINPPNTWSERLDYLLMYCLCHTCLYRDDDNDMEDDDDRVDFTLNAAERERQHMKDTFLAAEHGSDADSDQETRDWEQQQIKKVVSSRAAASDQVSE